MITTPAKIIEPPYLNTQTDSRRWEFNFKNEQIVTYSHPVSILFIGDSITHNWELNANFRQYGYIVNRGIGGDRVNHLSQRFEGDAIQLKPKLIVIMIGVNNTWEVCSGEFTCEETMVMFEENYRKMLTMAKEHNIPILPCTCLPTRCNSPVQDELLKQMNQSLAAMCADFGLEMVDYYAPMVAEDGHTLPELYSADGLHPNSIGYQKMTEIITPMLDKYLNP